LRVFELFQEHLREIAVFLFTGGLSGIIDKFVPVQWIWPVHDGHIRRTTHIISKKLLDEIKVYH